MLNAACITFEKKIYHNFRDPCNETIGSTDFRQKEPFPRTFIKTLLLLLLLDAEQAYRREFDRRGGGWKNFDNARISLDLG